MTNKKIRTRFWSWYGTHMTNKKIRIRILVHPFSRLLIRYRYDKKKIRTRFWSWYGTDMTSKKNPHPVWIRTDPNCIWIRADPDSSSLYFTVTDTVPIWQIKKSGPGSDPDTVPIWQIKKSGPGSDPDSSLHYFTVPDWLPILEILEIIRTKK